MNFSATRAWFISIRAGSRLLGQFVKLGFFHILDGTDHLLFLFCLVNSRSSENSARLIPVVTSFTIAHSITLIASAYDLAPDALWFPAADQKRMIAMSIVYMALENIVGGATVQLSRWMITFGVRARSRFRILVRVAADDAVRRLAHAHLAAVVQRRR